MKIVFFDDFRLGVMRGESIVDVSEFVTDIPMVGPHDLINGLILNFENYAKLEVVLQTRNKSGLPGGVFVFVCGLHGQSVHCSRSSRN